MEEPGKTFARRLARVGGRLALALSAALPFGLYAAFPALAFLGYLALVPWTLLYTDDRRSRVSWLYYFLSLPPVWLSLYPQAFRYGWIGAAILCLSCIGFWTPFAPVLQRVHRRFHWPRTLTVPLVWVPVEWLRFVMCPGHFDLYGLGYTQARFTWLVQFADLTGVYGVTFLVAAVNGFLADLLFALRDVGWSARSALRAPRIRRTGAALAASFVLLSIYGVVRLSGAEPPAGPRVALVQPDEPHRIRNVVGVHLAQVLLTEEEVAPGSADLIVWPENAIFDFLDPGGPYLEDLAWLAARKEAALLVGALGRPEGRPGRTTNAAFLVGREGEIEGRYDKQVLFPWSEGVPLDTLLERVWPWAWRLQRRLTRQAWGYLATGLPGAGMVLFSVPSESGSVPAGSLICHENAYPPLAAEAGRMGARFLVNITSESDLGGPVQEELLRISILRAIENRVGYVRVGNTGISGFIDPSGRVRGVLVGEEGRTILDRGVLIERVHLGDGRPTVYARSRDAFALAVAVAALAALLATFVGRGGVAAVLASALVAVSGCGGPRLETADVDEARSALERGRTLFERGDVRGALEPLLTACGERESCAEALPFVSDAFLESSRPEDGVAFFTGVLERYPELAPQALGFRGLMREKSLEYAAAERDFVEALERGAPARFGGLLGMLRRAGGDLEGAVAAFRQATDAAPDDVELRYRLARTLSETGRLREAAEIFERVLAEDPRHAPSWSAMGRILLEEGNETAAARAFRRAIELDRKQIEARYYLARLALRIGNPDAARRFLAVIQKIEAGLGRGPREP